VRLRLVEIPDTMTDWEKNDYDGIETITYVVDGKIYHA
jgi:redox-sensitive bicupin YhaK (pirin superfamily)